LQLELTEAVINQLGRIKTLRVEPLARVRRFGGMDQDLSPKLANDNASGTAFHRPTSSGANS
jgi:hypothetical protein